MRLKLYGGALVMDVSTAVGECYKLLSQQPGRLESMLQNLVGTR